jgi:hypothetical protein
VVAEPVFIEISAIQGAQFHPILLDLGDLGVVGPIRALVDYQVPSPPLDTGKSARLPRWAI